MKIRDERTITSQALTDAFQAPFPLEDIEWKVQTSGVGKDGKIWALVAPYLNADAIKTRLDELVGCENWKNEPFQPGANGGLQCGLSIRINNEWVTKWDGAENTQYEAVKGGMSDSFKRSARMWGVGRYLVKVGVQFATICEANGGQKAICKDKKSQKDIPFWWKPPGLPEWCLPKNGNGQKSVTEKEKRQIIHEQLENALDGKPIDKEALNTPITELTEYTQSPEYERLEISCKYYAWILKDSDEMANDNGEIGDILNKWEHPKRTWTKEDLERWEKGLKEKVMECSISVPTPNQLNEWQKICDDYPGLSMQFKSERSKCNWEECRRLYFNALHTSQEPEPA